MTNCIFVSKNNEWSDFLYKRLSNSSEVVTWIRISNIDEIPFIKDLNPDWIFFFHWSHIVSREIWSSYKCVVLHTSNLPLGRGGSPIQNQIMDKVISSKVNAIEMTGQVDSGGVYCSSEITLQGSLRDIWMTIGSQSFNLIQKCIKENPTPICQDAESDMKVYRRRKNSSLNLNCEISNVYDQIRMLDGEGYLNSNIKIGNFVIEFSRAGFDNRGDLICDARFRKI